MRAITLRLAGALLVAFLGGVAAIFLTDPTARGLLLFVDGLFAALWGLSAGLNWPDDLT